MAKLYPIGIQNFEKIRREGYLYIDKTALVCRLVKTGSYYFLSRPRRFGKSLLISTLEAYFQGKKDLFRGLAMEELEKDWIKYPILHLDLNTEKYDTPESLDRILNDTLAKWEMVYGTAPSETSIPLRFKGIVQRACEQSGQRVVILIDEYDKPIAKTRRCILTRRRRRLCRPAVFDGRTNRIVVLAPEYLFDLPERHAGVQLEPD